MVIYSRSIINFHKWVINPVIDDLDIDLRLYLLESVSQKPDKTPINVIVYGVKGTHSDIPIQIWDRLYYFDDDKINFEAPINMNNKDITDVNKIATKDLDVNNQIDVKGNKIIGVGDGGDESNAVNKSTIRCIGITYYQYHLQLLLSYYLLHQSDYLHLNRLLLFYLHRLYPYCSNQWVLRNEFYHHQNNIICPRFE